MLKKIIGLFSKSEFTENKTSELKSEGLSVTHISELPRSAEAFKEIGDQYFKSRDLIQAEFYYKQSLEIDPDQFEVYKSWGVILYYLGKLEEAVECYDRAIALKSDYPEAYNNRGLALNNLKRFEEALISLDRAIDLKQDFAFAYNNRGMVFKNLNRFEDALLSYDCAIAQKPDYAEAYNNRGFVLNALKHANEALESYEQAILLKSNFYEAYFNQGEVLSSLKRSDEALKSYERAIEIKSDFAHAYCGRAFVLNNLLRFVDALASIDQAIILMPDLAEAHYNRSIILTGLNRFEEALASIDQAVLLDPDNAEVHSHRGSIVNLLRVPNEALKSFERAIELEPDHELFYGYWLEIKKMLCDWINYEDRLKLLEDKINKGMNASQLIFVFWHIHSPAVQRKAAEIFVKSTFPVNDLLPPLTKYPRRDKIRVGYFSADFRNHAVSFLTAELFETHDKSRFELIAFSFSSIKDAMTKRLELAFDRFIDVSKLSDQEVAVMARELEIDIAIDLSGFTGDCRTGIFAMRAAPAQVNYLGYPGTMGADYIDYIIADTTIIPPTHQQYYSEKVAYLPSFQVNDTKRIISDRKFSREELGLPSSGFVFCCFNVVPKIAPSDFDSWMRILKQVEGSVLWLLDESPAAVSNLRKEAIARGVDSNRIVFAKRESLPDYLARYRMADLFLDTLPYNAGTTASDALWAGLPVLTQIGEAFAGRMAASLLNAIHLPELITTTQEEYQALAIELAMKPDKLARIKQKLSENRMTTPLFDIEYFTKHLESAYTQMYERCQAGLAPEHIVTA